MSKRKLKNWVPNKEEYKFVKTIDALAKGEKLVYHRGAYCAGKFRFAVRQLIDQEVVTAVTKKHGTNDYEYIAIKL